MHVSRQAFRPPPMEQHSRPKLQQPTPGQHSRPFRQQAGLPGTFGQACWSPSGPVLQTTAQLPVWGSHDSPAAQQTPLQQLLAQQDPLQYRSGSLQQTPLVQIPSQHCPAQQVDRDGQQVVPQGLSGELQHSPF